MRTWVDVAELTNTKTLNGGLVARSAPGLPLLLREGVEVAFVPPVLDAPRRSSVVSVQTTGADTCIVRFSDVQDIGTAELLTGCHCLMRRADVPKDDLRCAAPLWDGWSVVDAQAGYVGEVVCVEDRAAQPLLVVSSPASEGGSGKEVLIPLVEDFLVEVDETRLRITVDLPAGLLEL